MTEKTRHCAWSFLNLQYHERLAKRHDRLSMIRAKTLVIGGGQDNALGADASREIAGAIDGAALKMYPLWGHGLYEEAPEFNQTVLEFLRS